MSDLSQERVASVRDTPGEWLFYYTTIEDALIHILPTQRLRLSPFSKMRDPREYQEWSVPAAGFVGETTADEQAAAWAEASRRLNALKDEFKLLCLCRDDPEEDEGEYGRGYARSRMWEAYAGNGTGVCLTFHRPTATESIQRQLEDMGWARHGAVEYRNESLFSSISIDLGDALAGRFDQITEDKVQRHIDQLFLTKNTEWASEREYRFIVRVQDPALKEVFVSIRDSLAGVCMGPETPNTAFDALGHFASQHGFAVGKLLWVNNDPTLGGIATDRPYPGTTYTP